MARKRGVVARDEKEVFLRELARHGSVRKACRVAGVTRAWVRYQKQNDEFAIAFADAVEDSVDRLEEQAHEQALNGDERLLRYLLDVKRYKKTEAELGQVMPVINITIGS